MDKTLPLVVFFVVITVMMAIDLGVLNRRAHVISLKEASGWSAAWIILSLAFNVWLYFWGNQNMPQVGQKMALEFFTGYMLEKALSVDNIFVFVLIFSYFRVPPEFQHKVLFWGVIGALVLRAVFITLGIVLIEHFLWVFYIFGGFLVYTSIKMAQHDEYDNVSPEDNFFVRLCRRIFPITPKYVGAKFFTYDRGKIWATPLLLVLVMVETTDLMFALDSIPAIFAVTQDPFVVYTSNIFAILGLRSLFFVLIGIIDKFRYLRIGIASVLAFVGLKMLLHNVYKIPVLYSLATIALILGISIAASLSSAVIEKKDPSQQL
jgi:tellurite resistance protein TerC